MFLLFEVSKTNKFLVAPAPNSIVLREIRFVHFKGDGESALTLPKLKNDVVN